MATVDRGEVMGGELAEQPEAVAQLPALIGGELRDLVEWARPRVRHVIYVGRGTSANAGVYGQYLAGILGRVSAALAAPSLTTLYDARVQLDACLVVGISQSGETEEVVTYLEHVRSNGALTLAVTNEDASPLASAAHGVLLTHAGNERAIPATKTYTTQLTVLLLWWAVWARREDLFEAAGSVIPTAMRQALSAGKDLQGIAEQYRQSSWMVAAARGVSHPNAREAALKILETSYIPALSFSVAELWHGPVAAVQEAPLTVLIDYTGPASSSTADLAVHLRSADRKLLVVAPPGPVLDAASHPVALAEGLPELASPLVTILPAQEFARQLGLARGVDPDQPRGLSKVSQTR